MKYYVYALQSEVDGNLYIGITSDVTRRLSEHNKGKTASIRARVPFKVIYVEEVGSRIEARKRERYLKSGFGREFVKKYKVV